MTTNHDTPATVHGPLPDDWVYSTYYPISQDIIDERIRQQAKFGQQDCPSMYIDQMVAIARANAAKRVTEEHFQDGVGNWADILIEEVAEAVDEAVFLAEGSYHGSVDKLKAELIQVAAVAVAWIERLDRP